jgi:hypothetical protein
MHALVHHVPQELLPAGGRLVHAKHSNKPDDSPSTTGQQHPHNEPHGSDVLHKWAMLDMLGAPSLSACSNQAAVTSMNTKVECGACLS